MIYSEGDVDPSIFGDLAKEGMMQAINYFGECPFDHFVLFMEFLKPLPEHSYGFSLEHLESATMHFLFTDALTNTSSHREVVVNLYNIIHHMSHAWVPKRCYGEGYFPWTFELVPIIDSIWFGEGFAQYVAVIMTAQSNYVNNSKDYFNCMMQKRFLDTLNSAPNFIRQMDLVYLSRISSTEYSVDFRTGGNVFSRGAMMAYEMDELINKVTQGTKTLQDAIQAIVLWTKTNQIPWKIDQIPEIFGNATGVDITSVLDKWLQPQIGHSTRIMNFDVNCIA